MIDQLGDPLMHLIRNSMDHGIEAPEARRAAGKPPTGTIHLAARHAGAQVLVSVSDDGQGIDREAVRARAVEKGLIAADARLCENEIFSLILAPGFSTAKEVTDVSGRGVGMDVVRKNVEGLRGRIEIASQPGAGSTVTLRLPLTLAIIDGLLVRVGESRFVMPLANTVECVELTRQEVERANGKHLANVRGEIIPYIRLSECLRVRRPQPEREQMMVVETEHGRFGFVVDQVLGDHQTVIKNLGRIYRDVQVVSGATILGDGTVALILDLHRLAQDAISRQFVRRRTPCSRARPAGIGSVDERSATSRFHSQKNPSRVEGDDMASATEVETPNYIAPPANGHGRNRRARPNHGDARVTRWYRRRLRLVEASQEGRLSERGPGRAVSGVHREMMQGINAMLDAILLPIGEGNRILAQISSGKIDELIAQTYKGDHEKMKQAVNNVGTVLQALQKELVRLTDASKEGQLSERGKPEQFQGAYAEIVRGVNAMLDAILLPIGEGNRILAQISDGKIDELIAQTYKGDHEKMKQAVNNVAMVLQGLQKGTGAADRSFERRATDRARQARTVPGRLRRHRARRQRHSGRGDHAAERLRQLCGPDQQGRHSAADHRHLPRRLQHHQEQPEHADRGHERDHRRRPRRLPTAT